MIWGPLGKVSIGSAGQLLWRSEKIPIYLTTQKTSWSYPPSDRGGWFYINESSDCKIQRFPQSCFLVIRIDNELQKHWLNRSRSFPGEPLLHLHDSNKKSTPSRSTISPQRHAQGLLKYLMEEEVSYNHIHTCNGPWALAYVTNACDQVTSAIQYLFQSVQCQELALEHSRSTQHHMYKHLGPNPKTEVSFCIRSSTSRS